VSERPLFLLRLPRLHLRLVYLAVCYHLARPGAELDPQTMEEHAEGLRRLRPALESLLEREEAEVVITPYQLLRLDTALLSIVNELKSYPLMDAVAGATSRPRSLAPGFDHLLRRLFPEVAQDPDYAWELAREAVMVHRQLRPHVRRARQEPRR